MSPPSSLIIDGTCPPDTWVPGYRDWIAGGFSGCVVTAGGGSTERAHSGIDEKLELIANDPSLLLVDGAADLRTAHQTGKLGVVLQFQSTTPFGTDPDLVEVFWKRGIRMAGLAYNRRCPVGDGCEESPDRGLTNFGRRVVAEMNRVGMLVDFAHTGWRTSTDALDVSAVPCIASHSNAFAVREHPRNLPDPLITRIAASGGMIGVNGFPAFVAADAKPTLDDFVDHIVHIDTLVGSGHVGLGLDYSSITQPEYDDMIAGGDWSPENYPPPPWRYPSGIENPRTIDTLTRRLSERGYSDHEIAGILGENWLRLFEAVWP